MKIVSVIGTRPQFVKAAVVTRALRTDDRFHEVTVDTGQHYDHEMSQLLLDDLDDVQPVRNLGIHGAREAEVLAHMIEAVGGVLEDEAAGGVLVYGDTNSTLAGSLAASSLDVPLAHVEAGLRSFKRAMREERNRVVVDHLSRVLLCPTSTAVTNLAAEGVTSGVHHVGDVMFDAALRARAVVESRPSDVLDRVGVKPGQFSVATVHRAETTDNRATLEAVVSYLRRRSDADGPIVFPVHPRTRDALAREGLSTVGLVTCPPLGYLDMTRLVLGAQRVYTDSGGLQKEAYFHCTPCVTLRNETEWVETVDAGWNRLWTVDEYRARHRIDDYGDGHAAEAIVDVLAGAFR